MLVLVLVVLSVVTLAHWRARIIRLRLERHPTALALGSWAAPNDLPAPPRIPAAG